MIWKKIKLWYKQYTCPHDWIYISQEGKGKFRCRNCQKEVENKL